MLLLGKDFVKVSTCSFVKRHLVLAVVYVHLTTTSPKLLKQFDIFRQSRLKGAEQFFKPEHYEKEYVVIPIGRRYVPFRCIYTI